MQDTRPTIPFASPAVADAFANFPQSARNALLDLRELIFSTAADLPDVGPLVEELRWGQPAYLTLASKSGSTLRLGMTRSGDFALFAHCQTTIISRFRDHFEDEFRFDGNRAVLFRNAQDVKPVLLRSLISDALRYHLR